ncbi:Uncharacterized protein APZ42_026657 [Daphnia magna]|uniref:Uncharacterized protein n=1 Tax=Daphnia magna TaxID=35525 RepID=A0A162ECY0_9CRUS|nr:Uncharacterized protein APZ42_026657 [Daphnia magna]
MCNDIGNPRMAPLLAAVLLRQCPDAISFESRSVHQHKLLGYCATGNCRTKGTADHYLKKMCFSKINYFGIKFGCFLFFITTCITFQTKFDVMSCLMCNPKFPPVNGSMTTSNRNLDFAIENV